MARSKSSQRWLKEHFDDPYVKKAKQSGYRSRAAFKLAQIQEKDRLIKPGHVVVDLGAAPGGWSQLAADLVGHQGRVLAVDMLDMDALPGVEIIQGDFNDPRVFEQVMAALAGQPVDLVISDMAPNISGMKAVDQPRAIYLNELAVDFAQRVLHPGGDLLMKVFQGEGFDELLKNMRQLFVKVVIRKPAASRNKSTETYMLGKSFKDLPVTG